MKIYVAGKWEDRTNVRQLMSQLKVKGHKITGDWTGHEFDEEGGVIATDAQLTIFAMEDIEGVRACAVLIAVAERPYNYKGMLCEIGAAIVLGKVVFVLGDEIDSCIFMNYPGVYKQSRDAILSL